MKLTAFSKAILHSRRERRKLLAAGYEEVDEGGRILREINRGPRIGQRIVAAQIGSDGRSVFIKLSAMAEGR